MSKTPLTDHYTKRLRNLCDDEFVPIEFARKLERELVAVTEQRDKLAGERDEYRGLLIELYNDINVIHSGNAVAKLSRLMRDENYN